MVREMTEKQFINYINELNEQMKELGHETDEAAVVIGQYLSDEIEYETESVIKTLKNLYQTALDLNC